MGGRVPETEERKDDETYLAGTRVVAVRGGLGQVETDREWKGSNDGTVKGRMLSSQK